MAESTSGLSDVLRLTFTRAAVRSSPILSNGKKRRLVRMIE